MSDLIQKMVILRVCITFILGHIMRGSRYKSDIIVYTYKYIGFQISAQQMKNVFMIQSLMEYKASDTVHQEMTKYYRKK